MSDGGGDTGGDFGGNDGGGGSWGGNNDHHHHDTYHDNHHYGTHSDDWDNNYYDEPSNSRGGPCIALAIMIFGSIFFAVGAGAGGFLLSNTIEKVNSWESVIGTIIDKQSCGCSSTGSSYKPSSGNCSPTYAAVVEYEVDGSTYQFTSNSCSNPGPKVGNDIKVLYDPDYPGEAVSGNFIDLYLPTIVLSIFAVVGLGVCVFGIMMRKRYSNSSNNENTFDANNMALGQVGAETAYPSKPPMMQQTGWNQEPAKPTPSSTVQPAPPAVEESTPTNPYALHAQQQSQNTSTNNGGNSNGAKPSLFDQLNGKV